MAEDTKIEWAHCTFNPWWGCTKVSPECDSCYAESMSEWLGFKIWGHETRRRFFSDKHWRGPLKWNRDAEKAGERRRAFCGSMCDIMEERADLIPWRARLYPLIEQTTWIDWLLLTKRPQNFRRFLPEAWLETPRPNVWLMTTVGHPDSIWRIDALKSAPAVVHGLSIEPLLAPLPTLGEHLDGIDWAIIGGESGRKARPMHPDWARSARDQCVAAGATFFFKQWGEFSYPNADGSLGRGTPTGAINPDGSVVPMRVIGEPGCVSYWRVGKKAAGRLLDGREWNELPEVSR